MLASLARRAEAMGMTLETYVSLTGQEPDALVARLQEEAALSVARELVLEAAADKLGIVVDDERVESLVREQAELAGDDADAQLERLRENGRFEQLREDLRLRDALDRVASEVKRIPRELADAREQIWTPDKEKQQPETKLWTPGS
jgi:FKBP-type peptidyl-prolyl cis-trans isomerase (trigger factor)